MSEYVKLTFPIDISEILSEESVISLSETLCAMISEKKKNDVNNLIFLRICVFEAQILLELLNIKHQFNFTYINN